jgi:hypothetical protein
LAASCSLWQLQGKSNLLPPLLRVLRVLKQQQQQQENQGQSDLLPATLQMQQPMMQRQQQEGRRRAAAKQGSTRKDAPRSRPCREVAVKGTCLVA